MPLPNRSQQLGLLVLLTVLAIVTLLRVR